MYYLIPTGHTEFEKMAERSANFAALVKAADARNEEIVAEQYAGDADKWRNDGNAVQWDVINERSARENHPEIYEQMYMNVPTGSVAPADEWDSIDEVVPVCWDDLSEQWVQA